MNFRWLGPVALLATLFIADQIRIKRPSHKYRLTVEVETPEGVKAASSVISVHPDRGYSRQGHTGISGDAVFVDLGGGKNLIALLAHIDNAVDLDGMNYLALRAYKAAGLNVSFNEMSRMTGAVPVSGALIPILVTFGDLSEPGTARTASPHDLKAAFGSGFQLHRISAEVVPNGFWPLDIGGPLGEPRYPRNRGETAMVKRRELSSSSSSGGEGGRAADNRIARRHGSLYAEIAPPLCGRAC